MEVISVKHSPDRGVFSSVIEVKQPSGDTVLLAYVFPSDSLEWRAAEYGIDPGEQDLLLDIVLYEPFLPPTVDKSRVPLFAADTIEEARKSHVASIMDLKKQIRPKARSWKSMEQKADRLMTAGADRVWLKHLTEDALQPIRLDSVLDEEVIAEKAILVADARRAFRRDRSGQDKSRAEIFRSMRLKKEQ